MSQVFEAHASPIAQLPPEVATAQQLHKDLEMLEASHPPISLHPLILQPRVAHAEGKYKVVKDAPA